MMHPLTIRFRFCTSALSTNHMNFNSGDYTLSLVARTPTYANSHTGSAYSTHLWRCQAHLVVSHIHRSHSSMHQDSNMIHTLCITGLLASAIIKMNGVGGLAGWRWIFILEGLTTTLIALYSWVSMPANLNSARFFTQKEQAFARM